MAKVKVEFHEGATADAVFEGTVDPKGADGYTFSGMLTARCTLHRGHTGFENTVRLGHGGTSGEYTYLEFPPTDTPVEVKGEGKRAVGETVDFRVGVNTGASGQYNDGSKATVAVGGPPQKIEPIYIKKDAFDNISYDVRFDGHVWADGPTGYVIHGTLNAYGQAGTLTDQSATFGFKPSSGKWQYETFKIKDTPQTFTIRGERKSGDTIRVCVGATSRVANLYKYGSEIDCTLPETF
jgi:hypothetical protein